MDKGGIIIRVKTSVVLIALMVLLGTVTAASACPRLIIDVKPYSCPNPINLKNNGVVTIAADGAIIEKIYDAIDYPDRTSADALNDFQITDIYLKSSSGSKYDLDFDSTRLALEDVLIAPCCGGESTSQDGIPDLLIKIKNFEYNDADNLPEGEYSLIVEYTLDNGNNNYGAEDCVRVMY